MSVENALDLMCEFCREQVLTLFNTDPRPGSVIIAGDRHHNECCFVADEVIFNRGKLIFDPMPGQDDQYCRSYFLVCRKLTVIGGGEPLPFDICGTEDPGNSYNNKNVITWRDRLVVASPGSPHIGAAPDASEDWDRNAWSDEGQGNNGLNGGNGENGADGVPSSPGRDAPDFVLVALEVEFLELNGHLIIDFDGQVGGTGGRGQDGGRGGNGMGGRNSESDNTWPGKGCDRDAGNGGDGGQHGNGGSGGQGGDGGDAGHIEIITTKQHVSAGGAFVSGNMTYVNDGGNEGSGGLGGFGEPSNVALLAKGGRGGLGGTQCDPGVDGDDGSPGWPPFELLSGGSSANQGPSGAPGAAGPIDLYEIISHECTEPIPIDAEVDTVQPPSLCRGFDTPASNLALTVQGHHLAQVTGVSFSLAGVSAIILPTSNDTTLNLLVDLTGASGTGPCDLILERGFGGSQTFMSIFEVHRFEVLSISPGTGARNTTVEVTINGTCFDPTAIVQDVNVSGVGVSTDGVVVIDETTITAEFEISGAALPTTRDVTVVLGPRNHTLANAFDVTL